jgi:hypothetical protein
LERRLDPFYYIPSLIALEEKVLAKKPYKLRHYSLKLASGATPTIIEVSKYYANKNTGVPFIRVQNLNETGLLSLNDLKYINHETNENYLKRSQVNEDDLLVKITGVGRMAVAGVPPKGFEGNINQHIVVVKTRDRETSEVLAAYLNSDVGERLATRRATGGTRPALDYPALKSIPIVYEPRLIELVNKARTDRENKEMQAEYILSSFDEFVCEKLGFTSQYISTPLIGHRIYKTKNFKTFNSRLDPYYYQTHFDNYYTGFEKNNELVSLKELTREIFTGKTPPKENYTEEKSNIIVKAGALKGNEINWSKVAYATNGNLSPGLQDFDILLLSAAHQISYIGKNPSIVLIPNEMKQKTVHFVGELLCIRPDIKKVHPYYLLAVLKTKFYYQLINRETRGQTSHLYPDDVSKMKIPIPKDKSVQIKISMELQNRLSEAERLFSLAEEEFAQAKKEIERLILE